MLKSTLIALTAATVGTLAAGGFQPEFTGEKKPWTHERFLNEESRFTFVIVPDRTGTERKGVFQEALRKANLLQPHFIMSVGDLIEGMMDKRFQTTEHLRAQWRELNAFTARSEAPFFHVVGNHDICRTREGFPRANETSREVWKEFLGDRTYYYFIYKNVLFLCLDCMAGQDSREPQTSITADQLRWAKSVLLQHSEVSWTFVFIHQPDVWGSEEFEELEKLLAGRKYTAFAGDWHHYTKFVRHGRNYYVLATAGGVSKLRGVPYGEFDHLTMVSVTPRGPVVVNLKLDGIIDENAVTAATIRRPIRSQLDDPPMVFPENGKWRKTLDEKSLTELFRDHLAGGNLSLRNGVLHIDGDPSAKNNRWRSGRIPLDLPNPAGKKIRLTADIRTRIANPGQGSFHVRVRMAKAGDRTIDYTGIIINQTQDWTKVSVPIIMRPNTAATQLYVVGVDLDADSWGEVRNIQLEEISDAKTPAVSPKAPTAAAFPWRRTIGAETLRKHLGGGNLALRDGVVRVIGDPEAKNNRWRAGRIPLDLPNPAGKKIRLTADIRTRIANPGQGSFHVRVRMAKAGDRTIDYIGFIVPRSQPWTGMSAVLKLHPQTVAAQLYIVGADLDADSWGEVRNIQLEETDK